MTGNFVAIYAVVLTGTVVKGLPTDTYLKFDVSDSRPTLY